MDLTLTCRAKITDQWRNILRKAKTVDLRRDVVTLREAFERALEKKKKYIGGLLTELEEGEEQYSMAFRAQMENIERMMGIHQVIIWLINHLYYPFISCMLSFVDRTDCPPNWTSSQWRGNGW